MLEDGKVRTRLPSSWKLTEVRVSMELIVLAFVLIIVAAIHAERRSIDAGDGSACLSFVNVS